MNELISGFCCCDLVSYTDKDDGKSKYKLSFNAGRLTAALVLVGVGVAARVIW